MMPNPWIVRRSRQIIYIGADQEDAQAMCDYLNRSVSVKWIRPQSSTSGQSYTVSEYYNTGLGNKMKAGCSIWRVIMKKDGTLIDAIECPSEPNAFGVSSSAITSSMDTNGTPAYNYIPVFYGTTYSKTKEGAIRTIDKKRIKSLLDDRWTKVEDECREKARLYNTPGSANPFITSQYSTNPGSR
jgi:hypothetical protein